MRLENITLTTPYLSLDDEFYKLTKPLPLDKPYLISFSSQAAQLINLDEECCKNPKFIEILNGTLNFKDSKPFAMCYAGHQFGNYNPWLGDGRTLNLGKTSGWNLQLKGSGETYYARTADGRAVIASSIREYLMSEAMHHLGIPTTRALGVIGSKTKVLRNQMEDAAIVMRMSTSWIRFGSFEYFYYNKEHEKLKSLAEYVIAESYPELQGNDDRYFEMFCKVIERTATLIAKWQAIGFCHGVINTDNMSIEGLTIDYGPFSMLDDFNYNYKPNHTDKIGRYSYGEQPNISYWNLTMLSKALSPLISSERMKEKLDEFGEIIYPKAYINEMREKLGLLEKRDDDIELIRELVGALQDAYVDHTLFFRTLSHYNGDREPLYDICMEPVVIDNWLKLYDERLSVEIREDNERQKAMLAKNPKYILKNYMLEKAINLAKNGNFKMVDELLYIAQNPYEELSEFEHFANDTPEEYKNIGLSCSS